MADDASCSYCEFSVNIHQYYRNCCEQCGARPAPPTRQSIAAISFLASVIASLLETVVFLSLGVSLVTTVRTDQQLNIALHGWPTLGILRTTYLQM